jgi:hypothetical protein
MYALHFIRNHVLITPGSQVEMCRFEYTSECSFVHIVDNVYCNVWVNHHQRVVLLHVHQRVLLCCVMMYICMYHII